MTDKNPHLASNRLIAAAFEAAVPGKPGECVIGIFEGNAIVSLRFECGPQIEPGKRAIRAVCNGTDDSIVQICEAAKFEDLCDYLVNQCQIAMAHIQREFSNFIRGENSVDRAIEDLPYKQRFEEAERFNQVQKGLSPGLINEFKASGLMYSVVHQPAYRVVNVDSRKDRTIPEMFTAYIQNSAIADPDQCLVNTDSFDALFEAIGFIRTDIEQRLFKAFMPGIFQ